MRKFTLLVLCFSFLGLAAKKPKDYPDGENLFYRKNGSLKEKTIYKDGYRHGLRYLYHKDGKTIRQITEYETGKKVGIEKYYDKLGLLRDFKQRSAKSKNL